MKKKNIFIVLVSLFIGIILFICYILFFKANAYKDLEKNMENVVSQYLGQYIEEYPKGGEKKINITDVINKGYAIDMKVNNEVCDGYVIVKKVTFAYEYDAYIKCNNYVSKGYIK